MATHQQASTGQIVDDGKPTNANTAADSMHIKIYSPFKVYFDQQADSISAVNTTGPFDILPKHHNFMTLLTPSEIVVRDGNSAKKFKIGGGIMHVKADQVIVFLDV